MLSKRISLILLPLLLAVPEVRGEENQFQHLLKGFASGKPLSEETRKNYRQVHCVDLIKKKDFVDSIEKLMADNFNKSKAGAEVTYEIIRKKTSADGKAESHSLGLETWKVKSKTADTLEVEISFPNGTKGQKVLTKEESTRLEFENDPENPLSCLVFNVVVSDRKTSTQTYQGETLPTFSYLNQLSQESFDYTQGIPFSLGSWRTVQSSADGPLTEEYKVVKFKW